MFSLLITIISIALVAALALATLYYGSTAFNKGSEHATATKIINYGSQIQSASALRAADAEANPSAASSPTLDSLQTLVADRYLTVVPDGTWTVVTGGVVSTGLEKKVCEAVNAKLGITGVPQCSALAAAEGCCAIDN